MREVVTRRYSRLKEEGMPMPELVLIDGGVAHLDAIPGVGERTVVKLLKELGSAELVRAASRRAVGGDRGPRAARKVRAHYEVA
jgi:excinuclease UvrABC nuclease subunit